MLTNEEGLYRSLSRSVVVPTGADSKAWSTDEIERFVDSVNEIFDPHEVAMNDAYIKRKSSHGASIDEWVKNTIAASTVQILLTGDSGVGKTNMLAYWAAYLKKRMVVCGVSSESTLLELVQEKIDEIAGVTESVTEIEEQSAKDKSAEAEVKPLLARIKETHQRRVVSKPSIRSLKKMLASVMVENDVQVILFDNLQNLDPGERRQLGDLMEGFADLKNEWLIEGVDFPFVPKIVAAGVDMDIEDLYSNNDSRQRRIQSRHLDHMENDEIAEIARKGFEKLEVEITPEAIDEISFYSDGFPFYVKRICNAVASYWAETEATSIDKPTVDAAIRRENLLVDKSVEERLKSSKSAKDDAIRPRVLQLLANSDRQVFTTSDVTRDWPAHGKAPTTQAVLNEITNLVDGGILKQTRFDTKPYEYAFRDPSIRPYLRMNPIIDIFSEMDGGDDVLEAE